MGVTRTVSELKGDNCKNFPTHPMYFTPLLRGFPLVFFNGAQARKTKMMSLPDCHKSVMICPLV